MTHLTAYYLYLVSYILFFVQLVVEEGHRIFNIVSELYVSTSFLSQVLLVVIIADIIKVSIYKAGRQIQTPVNDSKEPHRAVNLLENSAKISS